MKAEGSSTTSERMLDIAKLVLLHNLHIPNRTYGRPCKSVGVSCGADGIPSDHINNINVSNQQYIHYAWEVEDSPKRLAPKWKRNVCCTMHVVMLRSITARRKARMCMCVSRGSDNELSKS